MRVEDRKLDRETSDSKRPNGAMDHSSHLNRMPLSFGILVHTLHLKESVFFIWETAYLIAHKEYIGCLSSHPKEARSKDFLHKVSVITHRDMFLEENAISRFQGNISKVCSMHPGEGTNCWLENLAFN